MEHLTVSIGSGRYSGQVIRVYVHMDTGTFSTDPDSGLPKVTGRFDSFDRNYKKAIEGKVRKELGDAAF